MTNGTRYAEQIGVRLPDGTRQTVTVHVVTDEEVLRHVSTVVGTIFTVKGKEFEVTSKYPFRIKKIRDVVEVEPPVLESTPPPSEEEPKEELTADEPVASPPQSERRASVPAVGECWKPKDPRRIASFTVKEVIPEQDLVITDDNRKSSSPGSNGTCES